MLKTSTGILGRKPLHLLQHLQSAPARHRECRARPTSQVSLATHGEGFRRIARLAKHGSLVMVSENEFQPLPHDGVVVDQKDFHVRSIPASAAPLFPGPRNAHGHGGAPGRGSPCNSTSPPSSAVRSRMPSMAAWIWLDFGVGDAAPIVLHPEDEAAAGFHEAHFHPRRLRVPDDV